jgi:hypothetical protein
VNFSPPAATSGSSFLSLFSGPRSVFASLVGAASAGPCTQPRWVSLPTAWQSGRGSSSPPRPRSSFVSSRGSPHDA